MSIDTEPFADIPDPVARSVSRPIPEPLPPAERSLTRRQTSLYRTLALALGAGWAVAVALYYGLRPDLLRAEILFQLATWTIAMPAGLALAVRPRPGGFPAGILALRLGLAALPTLFIALALLPVDGVEVKLSFRSVKWCMSRSLVTALPSMIGALVVLRGAFLNAPVLRGAVVGAVCGLAGTVAIHSHCPVVTPSHIVFAHGLPIVVFGALGALSARFRGRA
ncbi:MAG: NrsF family protein [Polyangiaceae bacterium]